MAGHCQDCDGCCRVFEVKDINKPFGVPCQHLGKTLFGQGCKIYAERPQPCQRYVCLWLDSQRRPEVEQMPENLRPNVCKVVMGWPWGVERDTLHVYPYPGHEDAWKVGPIAAHLRMVLARGGKVVVYINSQKIYALRGDMAVVGTEAEFANLLNEGDSNVVHDAG